MFDFNIQGVFVYGGYEVVFNSGENLITQNLLMFIRDRPNYLATNISKVISIETGKLPSVSASGGNIIFSQNSLSWYITNSLFGEKCQFNYQYGDYGYIGIGN